MQERRLRLGDVLDDYCPREKRLTNHAIVALVGDEVRTTRCSTCDFEHVYKQGKVPARRKKPDAQAALYKTVLDNVTGRASESAGPSTPPVEADPAPAPAAIAPPAPPPPRVAQPAVAVAVAEASGPAALAAAPDDPSAEADPPRREEPVHRHTLIRATLPKIEGQVPERKPADFTLWNVARQPQGRRGRHQTQQGGNANWGSYSPYANGHPSGKGPQQGQQPGKSRSNHRRGR